MMNETRNVSDIGMACFDLSVETCKGKTAYCEKECFNCKLYKLYKDMPQKDIRNDAYFINNKPDKIASDLLARKKFGNDRKRACSRGDCLTSKSFIDKTVSIVDTMFKRAKTLTWIPTRAWHIESLYSDLLKIKDNNGMRLMASIDPSDNDQDIKSLWNDGFSLMYFGDNNKKDLAGIKMFKCPKTFKKIKGHCNKCQKGCFSTKQVAVHLKKH